MNLDRVAAAVAEAKAAAAKATNDFLTQNGEWDTCGFAWITIKEKGNTKLGRELLNIGFSKAYRGGLEMWNPSGSPTQSITAKEVGIQAAVRVLIERLGVKDYASSRMD